MGNILNINSVVICGDILDVDTVLQGNILNVNSVPVDCGYSGNSWDCSATTKSDSCTGTTEINTTHTQPGMSTYFSNSNQTLVTTDYYYIDYTAATNSLSCLEKGSPKRQFLGWSIDNNGDALYSSPAGGGIIHNMWYSFINELNATGIFSAVPLSILPSALALIPPFSTGVSSYSPIFKDCECIYDCNCVAISGSSGAYSSMTQCLEDDKTCCAECEVNSIIHLAYDDLYCEDACQNICEYFYTDVVAPLPCPLSLGDHIYKDTSCTPAERGYYSPNQCTSACKYCYEVGLLGEIINITLCDPDSCNIVILYADNDGLPCPSGQPCEDVDCDVCKFNNKIYPYTDAPGSPPILMVGHHIYYASDCLCEPFIGGSPILTPGMYKWKDTTMGYDYCIELSEMTCEIVKKTVCSGLAPDVVVEPDTEESSSDDGEHGAYKPSSEEAVDWTFDKETGNMYYDDAGYRYYDVDGDGIADYSLWIGYEEGGGPASVVP
jgi:hypothetical protein|tara:strand:+ start:1500 stop:2978 length:1479 start_codon:yes stop_codon:yes gene_type:complete